MIPDTVFDLLLKGTALFAAGALVTMAMSRASAASRHAVWAAVCVAALALPIAQSVLPSVAASWWPQLSAASPPPASAFTQPSSVVLGPPTIHADHGVSVVARSAAGWSWTRALLAVWAIGLGVGLVRLTIGRRVARRLTAEASPEIDTRVLARADLIGGWVGAPRFIVRRGAPDWMPATWGVRRPVVVLPSSAEEWPDARLDPVLVHELAHVARRDAVWHHVAQIMVAVWWMHPLAWLAARRLRVERERACDDVVLAFGARASDYATELVSLAGECGGTAMTLAMARRSQLEGRVMAILNPRLNRNGRTGLATLVAGGLVVAMAPLAPLTSARLAAAADPEPAASMTGTSQRDAAEQAVRVGSSIPEPKNIKRVMPVYPPIAQASRVQGVVIVEIVIDESGAVTDAKALRPVALLTEAALDAVHQWRFTPTYLHGVPVSVVMTVTVNFALDSDGNPVATAPTHPPADAMTAREVDAFARGLQQGAAALQARLSALAAVRASDLPLRVGGVIKEPKRIKHVSPVYPDIAQQARVQGVVIIEAHIDEDGRVSNARVVRPVALLDDAALEAVLQWEFEPTLLSGQPVPVLMTVTVNFTLQ